MPEPLPIIKPSAVVDAARNFAHCTSWCLSHWLTAKDCEEMRQAAAVKDDAEGVSHYAGKCESYENQRDRYWQGARQSGFVLIGAARAWGTPCDDLRALLTTLHHTWLPGVCGVDPKTCLPPNFEPAEKEAAAIGEDAEIRSSMEDCNVQSGPDAIREMSIKCEMEAKERNAEDSNMAPIRGLGWTFQDLPDHQTRAYHRQLCEQYADLDSFDLLELCGKWRALAKSFTKDACASGRHGAHVIHDSKVDTVTRLLETACADRGLSNTDRLGRSLRRPDNDHLHYALALLDDLEARLRAEAVAKGIGTVAAKPANRGNGETGPAPINAIHSYLSASTKDQDDSLIAGYARATAGDLLAGCNRMIQCLAGFDTVFLMSPKGASKQASQIDDEWFKGFNRTHETLCLAASARKMDVAPYKRLTNCAYAFWKGAADPKSTETEWKLLFPPGIEVLHNLKRAMMVEMAKADAESQAAFAKGARILDRAHRERCFKEIDAAVKRGDVSAALNIFADDVEHFAGHLKDAVFALMASGDSARSHRRMCSAKDGSPMRPDFGNDFIGIDQVYAMLEVRPGPEQAMQFARRVNELNEATLALADRCCAYDGPGGTDIPLETMLVIDETRSDVKRHALGLARDMRVWASQLGAGTAGVKMTAQQDVTSREKKATHNADFTMVNWFGEEYTFALGVQSSALKALWEEWEKTGLGLHQDTIRNSIDAERDSFRMDTAFRKHPAFGRMIKKIGDGKYKLACWPGGTTPAPSKKKKSAGITSGARQKPV